MKSEKLAAKLCEKRATQVLAPVKLALEMKVEMLTGWLRLPKPTPAAGHHNVAGQHIVQRLNKGAHGFS